MQRVSSATFDVAYGARARLRMLFFSMFFIAPPAMALALGPIAAMFPDVGADNLGGFLAVGTAAAALLVCVIVPSVCLQRRHPHRTTLTLDGWGATEREGDDVRTAIPWAKAAVYQLGVRLKDTAGRDLGSLGGQLAVRDPLGHVVYAAAEARVALFGGHKRPSWAFRRRVAISVKWTSELLYPFDRAETLKEVPIDVRDARRGRRVFSRAMGLLLLVVLALAGVTAPASLDDSNLRQPVGLALVIAAVFALLRALRPWNESQTLRKSALTFREAPAFDLAGASEGSLTAATDATGARIELDLSAVQHPDAALATRTTRVFAVVDAAGGGAYRDGAIRVTAVETARDRRERLDILHANRIEIAARLAFAAFAFVDGVMWYANVIFHQSPRL